MDILHIHSITYAIKAQDILSRRGIRTRLARTENTPSRQGCGYILLLDENAARAIKLLNASGIKFTHEPGNTKI